MANPIVAIAKVAIAVGAVVAAGCESAHVGVAIPVPGPIKPSVGMTVNKQGVRGVGGVSASAGPVSVGASGSTKIYDATAKKAKPMNATKSAASGKSVKSTKSAKRTKPGNDAAAADTAK